MKVHEHQAKEILKRFEVAIPEGQVAYSVEEAVRAAESLGGTVWGVKAQIHAGGRGKGGGVKVAKSGEGVHGRGRGNREGRSGYTREDPEGVRGQGCGIPALSGTGSGVRAGTVGR